MNMRSLIKLGLLTVVLWIQAGTAFALCEYATGQKGSWGTTAPLQISSLSVGSNVPLGTVIYRQRYTNNPGVNVTCPSWANYTVVKEFWNASETAPVSSWNTGPYANRVYATDVPGIGSAYDLPPGFKGTSSSGGASAFTYYPCPGAGVCTIDFTDMAYLDLVLIKIGDVSPGTIKGNQLTVMSINGSVYENNPYENPTVLFNFEPHYSGAINIVPLTCQTPDVNVLLGDHTVSEFKGVGSGTAWKNFNIVLTNCPAARSYATNGPILTESGVNGAITAAPGVIDSNVSITLNPTGVAIDAAHGIFGLNAPATSAQGIGVQLADSSNSPIALNTLIKTGIAIGSYNIPLSARYTQVSTPLVPGPANASVTFTLTYQ